MMVSRFFKPTLLRIKVGMFVFGMVICFASDAQTISSRTKTILDARYNQTTIVRDSDGVQYDYATWYKLYYSGAYILKPIKTVKTNAPAEYVLCKPTKQDIIKYSETYNKPTQSPYFKTGEPIKPFSTHDINGKKVSLKDLAGKVVVLNFLFINKCTSCQVAIPELNSMVKDYKSDSNVVFIAIAVDDVNIVSAFLRQVPFDYEMIDTGQSIADKYDIKLYPTHVVIDKQGIVRFHTSGNSYNQISWIRKTIDQYK